MQPIALEARSADSTEPFVFDYREIRKDGIAHSRTGQFSVLAIDVVKFTALGNNDSFRDCVHELEYTIRTVMHPVKWDERKTRNGAILNPTGDGYIVAFDTHIPDEDVLQYARAISKRLAGKSIFVRMGLSKGSCFIYRDLNSKLNLCGWGIIDAARAMSYGGSEHILCTYEFAHDYQGRHQTNEFHQIGKVTIKERELILLNYYRDGEFGNPTTPVISANSPIA
jgi:hypothetical protein